MENNNKLKGLNISLWVAQILLAGMFMMAGFMKLAPNIEVMTKEMPAWLVRFIGVSETLGGLGLLLPSILRIKPVLTPWAAVGILTIMILATILHVSKGQFSEVGITVALGCLAVFVAWGRFKKVPILPKTK
ncbi:MAG: DoxX family protein [Bacteroidota bacterium]